MATTVLVPQAPNATGVVIVASGSYTAGDTYGPWPMDFFDAAEITTTVTVASGTLVVFVQKQSADGVLYDDLCRFGPYVSQTGSVTALFTNTISFMKAQTSQSTTVWSGSSNFGLMYGGYWQVVTQVSGQGATFNFGVFGNFRSYT